MLRLALTCEPRWIEVADGVRLRVRPLTTALMAVATTEQPEADHLRWVQAIARLAIEAWEGVGDLEGRPVEPTPEYVDALLQVPAVFAAFQQRYIAPGLALQQEKKE